MEEVMRSVLIISELTQSGTVTGGGRRLGRSPPTLGNTVKFLFLIFKLLFYKRSTNKETKLKKFDTIHQDLEQKF